MTRPTVESAPSPKAGPDVVRPRRLARLVVASGFYVVTGVAAAGAASAVDGAAAERFGVPVALPPVLAALLVIGLGGTFADRLVTYLLARCPLLVRRGL